jgi:tetratricopeptide (TPR) repeat protein
MANDPRVIDLLSRYRQLRAQGQTPSPEELCRACPELLPALMQRLAEDAPTTAPGAQPLVGTIPPTPLPGTAAAPGKPRSGGSGSSVPPRPEVPGYEILGELGRGGMGIVYKARELAADRIVALKMILAGGHADPEDLVRFRIEAEAVCRLQHANIVQVHEISEHNGLPYFSLEYCSGGSLADTLDGTPLPAERAARLIEPLARAIQAAFQQGIIHRDLKPANVLLADSGEPKITDFGLAKRLDAATVHTQTGAVMGTPSYMSPEQAAGRTKELGPATDIYGLGAILYELLTGRPPFKAATAMETMQQVVKQEPASPRLLQPTTPRDLETICLKCLQKEPRKRYASAAELANDLGRFLTGQPIHAQPIGTTERLWQWCRRNPMVAGLTAAIAGLVIVFAIGATIAAVAYKDTATRERERTQELVKLEIKTFLLQGKYDEAFAKAQQHEADLPEGGAKARADILAEWLSAARKELQNKNYGGALATASALLARFPNQPEATNLRKEAFHGVLSVEVRTLLQQERHADALDIVRRNRTDLPRDGSELEAEVRTAWLRKAGRELKDRQFDIASETTRRLLAAFKDDAEGQGIARQAAHGLMKAQVSRLIADRSFVEAAKAIDARRTDLPNDGADLKDLVRTAWLAQADAASADQRFDQAVKICDAVLASFRDDAEAQKRRAAYAGKVQMQMNEKARALVARAKELEDTAAKLRRVEDPSRLLRADDAERTGQILKEATDLWTQAKQPPPLALRAGMALAAYYKSQPDLKLFQKLAAGLLGGPEVEQLGFEVYPLLLAQAKAQDNTSAGRDAARWAYVQLLNLARKRHAEKTSPLGLYAALQNVADALQAASTQDKAAAQLLARCYATQGRLLREHNAVKWPLPNPAGKAFELYSKAVELDPTNAEFLIRKAYSRTTLPNPDWHEIEDTARTAIKLAAKDATSHGLLGYVYLMQSRRESNSKARVAKLQQALAAYQEAIDDSNGHEEDLPTLLLNRSISYLDLATNLPPEDAAAVKKYLLAAQANAEHAARLKHPSPEYIHETLGLILEKMAQFPGESDKYAEAVAEFGKAIRLRPERPTPRVGRARSLYRLAALGKGDKGTLKEALTDLRTLPDKGTATATLAEGYYWQGMIHQLTGNGAEAHQVFTKAASVGQRTAVQGWAREAEADLFLREATAQLAQENPEGALERVEAALKRAATLKALGSAKALELFTRIHSAKAEILLAQAEALLGQNTADAQGRQYLAEARRLADGLEAEKQGTAAASIRGQAFVIAGNPEGASKAFSKGLPADSSQATAAHAALLVARTGFYLSNRCPAALRPAPQGLIADADRAAEVAATLELKADALALAGAARSVAALGFVDQPRLQERYREQAADKLRKAIAVQPSHPANWAFRWSLAKELHSLAAGVADARRREAYREEARSELSKALERAPARYREELQRFQAVLDDGKKGG